MFFFNERVKFFREKTMVEMRCCCFKKSYLFISDIVFIFIVKEYTIYFLSCLRSTVVLSKVITW